MVTALAGPGLACGAGEGGGRAGQAGVAVDAAMSLVSTLKSSVKLRVITIAGWLTTECAPTNFTLSSEMPRLLSPAISCLSAQLYPPQLQAGTHQLQAGTLMEVECIADEPAGLPAAASAAKDLAGGLAPPASVIPG